MFSLTHRRDFQVYLAQEAGAHKVNQLYLFEQKKQMNEKLFVHF